MPSAKELAKALAYRGEIRNTPQNSFLGGVANFLAPVSEFADRDKLPGSIPLLGGMSFADLSGLKGAQSLVNDMSYGTPPIRGASLQTAKVDPRVLDLAGVSGAMIPVGRALGKAALREGARQIETGTGVLGSKVIDPRQRMFAGEGAKTADHGALKVAKDMKAAGVPDEQIHAKTKWTFAFADGKPRFEIDDSAAKFNMNSDIQNKIDANRLRIAEIKDIKRDSLAAEKTQPDLFPKDLSRARASLQGEANNLQTDISGNFGLDYPGGQSAGFRYEHPGLYDAYPEIKERVVVSTGGGKGGDLLGQQYQDRIDINHPAMYEFKTNPKTGYTDYAETPMKAKSTATHEFQHRIQDAEGFARGGSPDQMLAELRKSDPELVASYERQNKLGDLAFNRYRRLAGEAEARLTQSRMNMTPAERAASYPPSMFDVPVKDQIVRYGDNVGGAMMQRPKPSGLLDYQIEHKPMTIEGGAAPLHDLAKSFGEDVYGKNALQYYGSGDARESGTLRLLQALRGKPDAQVTIYRGAPSEAGGINAGDWVTLDKRVAQDYVDQALASDGKAGKVFSQKVPASHITSWPDSLMEFGYHPK